MGGSVVMLAAILVYGSFLGLGAVGFRRYVLKDRAGADDTAEQRILDEVDQLDVQVSIFNERLKRVEDEALLGSGDGHRPRALNRGK